MDNVHDVHELADPKGHPESQLEGENVEIGGEEEAPWVGVEPLTPENAKVQPFVEKS